MPTKSTYVRCKGVPARESRTGTRLSPAAGREKKNGGLHNTDSDYQIEYYWTYCSIYW